MDEFSGVVWAGRPRAADPSSPGIVCFRQSPPDAGGIHALVDVGSARHALPPLAIVTLERIDEPGEWAAPWYSDSDEDFLPVPATPTRCRLFTVRVAWA